MSRHAVELDFFAIERISAASDPPRPVVVRHGIQGAVSPIAPQLLRSVIASSSTNLSARSAATASAAAAPLTIFYRGAVVVFDLPRDKAEAILKMATEEGRKLDSSLPDAMKKGGDVPLARRRSLQRFLEKRKERILSSSSPYAIKSDDDDARLSPESVKSGKD